MRMTLGPNRKNPPHRRAGQRERNQPRQPDNTRLKPARNHQNRQPQTRKPNQPAQIKNQFRQLDSDSKQPKSDRPKTADKNPTDNRTAKANRTTCQKPQANKPPAMKRTTKGDGRQNASGNNKPPKPQLSQPAKPIRRRQCSQTAESEGDAETNPQRN